MRSVSGARLADLPQARAALDAETLHSIRVVSAVLPFKVNNYVAETLIDWSAVPDDPIYRLTFPHRDMLPDEIYDAMSDLVRRSADRRTLTEAARTWRLALNPHPSGQLEHNVPVMGGEQVPGIQHKYRETALVFPSQGQTCHAYCGYCFRWAQFVGMPELRLSAEEQRAPDYLRTRPELTDVLFTGGDPLIMSTERLRRWIEPVLAPGLEHIRTIRLGTKAVAYWPYRFTTDRDADDLMRVIERCAEAGRHVAVMLHVSHPRELATDEARAAVRRLLSAGATLRAQAPIIRYVNDDPAVWAEMWQRMVELGVIPYYAFVERDTGARRYFEVPLARALRVVQDAQRAVSGLARTARGPVMSADPGKVVVDGEAVIGGERVFVLRMLQARDAAQTGRPFFAHWSPDASWLNDLKPALDVPWPWHPAGHTSGTVPSADHDPATAPLAGHVTRASADLTLTSP